MKVYLIRHAEPQYEQVTEAGYVGYGRDLGALTDAGIQMAQTAALDPMWSQVQLVLSSPYTRALQTTLELVRDTPIPVKVALGLHEWRPDVTGRELANDQQAIQAYQVYIANHRQLSPASPLHYETGAQVKTRVKKVLDRYKAYDCIACVTHGEVIRQFVDQDNIDYCQIFEINY